MKSASAGPVMSRENDDASEGTATFGVPAKLAAMRFAFRHSAASVISIEWNMKLPEQGAQLNSDQESVSTDGVVRCSPVGEFSGCASYRTISNSWY